MKKMDVFIIVFFVLLALIGMIFVSSSSRGSKVMIYADGKLYGEYSLNHDEEITIEHNGLSNSIHISDGRVCMVRANCNNQICVNQGYIGMVNESICCVPNGIIVTIIGEKEAEYDAILY